MDNNNVIYDDRQAGLSAFFNRIYAIMGLGVLTSAAVAYIMVTFFYNNLIAILSMNQFVVLIVFLVPMFIVVPIQRAAMNNSSTALPLFFGYAGLMGFVLSMILLVYTAQSIGLAFIVSSSMFFVLSIFGRMTKRDLGGMGKAAFAAVWGLIIASVVNFFLHSEMMLYIISYAGVVIFSILIAWNNQMIERVYRQNNGQVQEGWAIAMALALYVSFLNLFLSLLRIFGGGRG
jgi:FtsH-binding integral membrane protein